MKDSAFPMMIIYVDMDEVETVKSPEEIEAGRSFVILETQCPMIQWAWFFGGFIAAAVVIGGYYLWLWR